jgi:hypothetical protein
VEILFLIVSQTWDVAPQVLLDRLHSDRWGR